MILRKVEQVMKQFKDRKSQCVDEIPAELIKAGGPALTNEIHRLCNVIRRKEGWPEQWQSQSLLPSHTRTVVRECKGNDASQWENGKIDPLPRPNPLTDRHKNLHTWLRNGYLPTCRIWSRSLHGFLFPIYAKLRIKMFTWLLFFFFFFFVRVLPTAYSLDAWTDFHAWYVKRRGSAQECAFSGLEDKKLTFTPRNSRKTAIFGHDLGLRKFSTENRFTMGVLPCKLPLIVVVAP